jgi:hypothetical protein
MVLDHKVSYSLNSETQNPHPRRGEDVSIRALRLLFAGGIDFLPTLPAPG